ncbi:MAG: hypothetical protein ABI548_07015 [Polyangiaceae bacterium]
MASGTAQKSEDLDLAQREPSAPGDSLRSHRIRYGPLREPGSAQAAGPLDGCLLAGL